MAAARGVLPSLALMLLLAVCAGWAAAEAEVDLLSLDMDDDHGGGAPGPEFELAESRATYRDGSRSGVAMFMPPRQSYVGGDD